MAQTKYQQLEDLWTAIRIIVKHKGGEEMSVKELRQAIYFEVAELEREIEEIENNNE